MPSPPNFLGVKMIFLENLCLFSVDKFDDDLLNFFDDFFFGEREGGG